MEYSRRVPVPEACTAGSNSPFSDQLIEVREDIPGNIFTTSLCCIVSMVTYHNVMYKALDPIQFSIASTLSKPHMRRFPQDHYNGQVLSSDLIKMTKINLLDKPEKEKDGNTNILKGVGLLMPAIKGL